MRRFGILLVLCLSAVLVLPAGSAPASPSAFLGTDFLISTAPNQQMNAALAYNDDDNEWLVVWEDYRSGIDIYALRVSSTGVVRGDPIIVWDSADYLLNPAVAYDSTQERYLVVWQNHSNPAIEGRVLNADGTFFSSKFDITTGTKARTKPDVAYNPVTDEYLVVWEYEEATGNHDIWGRKVGVDGVADPGGTYVISNAAADELTPALLAYPASASGQYLLVWSSDNSGTFNVVGRRLLSDGTPNGVTFGISNVSGATGDESVPQLALNTTNNQALVVWQDSRSDIGDIYGRLVNSDGTRGTAVAIQTGAGSQEAPDVAYNIASGEFLVVWDDGYAAHGRRIAAAGTTLGASFVICEAAGYQKDPVVAPGSSSYLAVWHDYRNDWEIDLFGRRISQAGALLGNEVPLSIISADQDDAAVAFGTQQQQWLVVWQDKRNGNYDIYAQRVDRDGLLVGQEIAICTQASTQAAPAVAYNPDDDQFLVVWFDYRNGNEDIYARAVNAADGSLTVEIVVTNAADTQRAPAVAYSHPARQYLVVWQDNRDGNMDQNIYGRRLNADGTAYDASDFVICARTENQANVDVAFNPLQRNYLVVWNDHSMAGIGIAGQRVRDSDPRIAGNNFDIATGSQYEYAPSVACNTANGEYLVAWEDGRNGATDYNIYGRRVSATGTLLGTGDIAISTAANNQTAANVSYDPSSNRYYACWTDARYGDVDPDVFGQSLSAGGGLLFTRSDENVSVWTAVGSQSSPAAAADPSDGRGLIVWQDLRNTASTDIYGRLGEPSDLIVYLPLVLNND